MSTATILSRAAAAPASGAPRSLPAAQAQAEALRAGTLDAGRARQLLAFARGASAGGRRQAAEGSRSSALRQAWVAGAERELAAVVGDAVRQVLAGLDGLERTRAVVTSALSALRRQSQAVLRVPAEHAEALAASADELRGLCPGMTSLKIVADSGLAPGTCVLSSDLGSIATSIDEQMDKLLQAITTAAGDLHRPLRY